MSRLISEILGAKEPLFSIAIKHMEEATGRPSVDVKLTAEIISAIKSKTVDLGLDPNDTAPKELYHALINKIKNDDEHLQGLLGQQKLDEPSQIIEPVVKAINSLKLPNKCWVIRKSAAKELLKKMPPKNVMQILKYKSIASMLKNESIFELFAALRFAESPVWLEKFNTSYKTLTPPDFETRNIEIVIMPEDRWAETSADYISKKLHCVTHLKEMGVIAILPPDTNKRSGFATLLALLILHYINEIRAYSSFFKLEQVKSDFAKNLAETLNNDTAHPVTIANHQIHWRIVQRYWGKLGAEYHPEMFEPHVQPEDLYWRKAEKSLTKIDNEFSWWHNLDYVGWRSTSAVVSLNLMDVAINYYQNLDFENSQSNHLKESLWSELFIRYIGQKVLEQQVLRQLDGDLLSIETVNSGLKPRGI